VLHANHINKDDEVAVIGSSNMDMRSFSLNYEISVMLHGRHIVAQLREVEESYREQCTELLLDDWLTRPLRSKVLDNTARLTAAVQ
jgi:cardiolipin synthase